MSLATVSHQTLYLMIADNFVFLY